MSSSAAIDIEAEVAKIHAKWPLVAQSGTAARIVETAWELMRERGVASVTMADVAAGAGLSRQAVYLHFSSRAGLYLAMVRHQDATSGHPERIRAAVTDPDPVAALTRSVEAWCDYIPEVLPVGAALQAAAMTDDAAAEAWRDRMDAQLAGLRILFGRLEAAGCLRPGLDAPTAAEAYWSLAHIDNWRHLVEERAWSPDAYRMWLTDAVATLLLA